MSAMVLATPKRHKSTKVTHKHRRYNTYTKRVQDTAIATGCTSPEELISFAKSLEGIRYQYGSTNPERGFDCSGFVNYVFNHFGIKIPRSSADFASFPNLVDLKDAKFGDLILFTGTKKHTRRAGHIGIVVSMPGDPLMFIHSTSGEANGVTQTAMNDYYMGRYMKIIRILPQTDDDTDDSQYQETAAR
ncbi:C40 family peptidase [Mucilaginibacter sp. FT3.2]|uniref:C40 family peptidase n=1 Tax=Mucilaginibacter sp. FT3.2 TaxID=2723090 RepID=UPI00160C494D|nr:C40 family peptidase [Mucilaginibacter sp. FT3.2]MBB6233051.1 cell wall-associated NlpC family hydrolase [Mucilaginibacter sp. FT3.2]